MSIFHTTLKFMVSKDTDKSVHTEMKRRTLCTTQYKTEKYPSLMGMSTSDITRYKTEKYMYLRFILPAMSTSVG